METEYKTICDKCGRHTWYETEQPCHVEGCTGTLRVIDNSLLDARFTSFYKSGERIEVTYKWGEKQRFYVGKSTGWKPIYLTILKSNSMGGAAISTDSVTNIQPLGKYNR